MLPVLKYLDGFDMFAPTPRTACCRLIPSTPSPTPTSRTLMMPFPYPVTVPPHIVSVGHWMLRSGRDDNEKEEDGDDDDDDDEEDDDDDLLDSEGTPPRLKTHSSIRTPNTITRRQVPVCIHNIAATPDFAVQTVLVVPTGMTTTK